MCICSVGAAQKCFNARPLERRFKRLKGCNLQQQYSVHTRAQIASFPTLQSLRGNANPFSSDNISFCAVYHITSKRRFTANESNSKLHLKYGAAAAFSAKNHYYRQHNHWTYESQDSSKSRFPAGQDAFFVTNIHGSESLAVGVADGVGGWSESNIDPAIFARSLCNNMARTAASPSAKFSAGNVDPRSLMEIGYKAVMKDSAVIGGGSTACVAIASENGGVSIANLGDSGCVHIRLNAIRFKSEAQQHTFNAPFQLSKVPPQLLRQMFLFGGGQTYSEYPKDAHVTHHVAQHGDVFILATDGVWDNLTSGNILEITNKVMIMSDSWQEREDGLVVQDNLSRAKAGAANKPLMKTVEATLASAIVREAKMASLDRRRDSPFAKRSREEDPSYAWTGGKIDDICVVTLIAQRA